MKVATLLSAVLIALVASKAKADTQLYMPFGCSVTAHVTVGSTFHSSYEVDWNIGSGEDDAWQNVVAEASGTVIYAGNSGCGLGYKVVIDHGGGSTTTYAHLQSPLTVAVGDKISVGTNIGYVGATGWCQSLGGKPWSSHLHTEYRINGVLKPPYYVEAGGYIYGKDPAFDGKSYSSDNCDYNGPPPTEGVPPRITRAYAVGQGTANPEAWDSAWQENGGVQEVGIAINSPFWNGDYVQQDFLRPRDLVHSIIIHNETGKNPRAFVIQDAFHDAYLGYGGLAVLGPPISNKYNLGPGADRQDYANKYIVHDSQGFHLYSYPYGFAPGQGSSHKTAFHAGFTAAGGDFFGNPAGAIFVDNGYEEQIIRDRSGKNVRMVLLPGHVRAYSVKSQIYDAWMASGHVYGGWGPPTSDEAILTGSTYVQFFRYGKATKDSKGKVTFTPNPSSAPRSYAPGETMNPDRAVHIIEAYRRNGDAGKLGACTAPYDISGYNYQYCTGGSNTGGRNAIVLNYNWGGYVAVVVRGAIETYWESTGGIGGPLGTPLTEEFPSTMMAGSQGEEFSHQKMQWYEYAPHVGNYPYGYAVGDGSTYQSAFMILRRYDADVAGYPKTWIYWSGQAQLQDFVNGLYGSNRVSYVHDATSRAARAYLMKGGVGKKWWSLGGGTSYLGLPVSDEVVNGTQVTQYFQFGVISGDTNTAVYQDHAY